MQQTIGLSCGTQDNDDDVMQQWLLCLSACSQLQSVCTCQALVIWVLEPLPEPLLEPARACLMLHWVMY